MVSAQTTPLKINLQAMNTFQKIAGTIFPPYKFRVLSQEQGKLFNAIIAALPDDFGIIKTQTNAGRFFGFNNWNSLLFPEYKFISMHYGGETIFKYRKRGQNFKISGLQLFSKRNNKYEEIEILIHENIVTGLKISNSDYQLGEFDLSKIKAENIVKIDVVFPPSDLDTFYDNLNDALKEKLNYNDLFEIDFNGREFYAFFDLEDGNYLAVDKNQKVYSLIHDAKPMATRMKITFKDILNELSENKFDKEQHLDNRYKNSK